jgi:hypothetical protein
MQHIDLEDGPRNYWWTAILVAIAAMSVGAATAVHDVRGYEHWPRKNARVVRHETGVGWTVPVYQVSCYDGLEELHGAKYTFLDGAPPKAGEELPVACRPAPDAPAVVSAPDRRALLHRDGVFIFAGAIVGAMALRKRRGEVLREKRA